MNQYVQHSLVERTISKSLLQIFSGGQTQVVNARGHGAGLVVWEVGFGVLWGHSGEEECPTLAGDRLMIVGPIRWGRLKGKPLCSAEL